MTNPKLTDEAVGRLPLSRARAELLEDIMASAPLESLPVRRPRRRTALLAVGTAAATVAALFAVPALLNSADTTDRSGGAGEVATTAVAGERLMLDAPGWTPIYVSASNGETEVQYAKGGLQVDLYGRPAAGYAGYYEDRSNLVSVPANDSSPTSGSVEDLPTPPGPTVVPENDAGPAPTRAPGEAVTLLGQPGEMWAYNSTDHTTIGQTQGEWFPEVRGSGMDKAAYVELLTHVRQVSDAEFESSLPETFVVKDPQTVVLKMMADMPAPPSWEYIRPAGPSRYQLGVSAAAGITCAWLAEWTDAKAKGDLPRALVAVDALASSHDWSVLKEMDAEGDYPEAVWGYADQVAAGKSPTGYRGALGCP